MKKRVFLLAAALLLVLAAGCRPTEPEPVDPAPPPQTEPLRLETLAVEISRSGLEAGTLASAVKALPALLADCFDKTQVEIGEVRVTVGASPADTVQALAAGSVHLAFLPAEGFVSGHTGAAPLFADTRAEDHGDSEGGVRALICAAPTQYGMQLAGRAAGGKPLSWNELANARWGVLEAASLDGYRCFDLWLADEYAGRRVADLSDVTAYDGYEALFRAAAAGEIDALVLRDDVRADMEEAWLLEHTRTDSGGIRGFGRSADIWQELAVLEVTERLYSQVAVVAQSVPELTDERFAEALEQVLEELAVKAPEQMPALGAARFTAVTDEQLDPTRRLLALG